MTDDEILKARFEDCKERLKVITGNKKSTELLRTIFKDNPEAIEDLENLNKHLDEEQADYFKYLDDLFKEDTQS